MFTKPLKVFLLSALAVVTLGDPNSQPTNQQAAHSTSDSNQGSQILNNDPSGPNPHIDNDNTVHTSHSPVNELKASEDDKPEMQTDDRSEEQKPHEEAKIDLSLFEEAGEKDGSLVENMKKLSEKLQQSLDDGEIDIDEIHHAFGLDAEANNDELLFDYETENEQVYDIHDVPVNVLDNIEQTKKAGILDDFLKANEKLTVEPFIPSEEDLKDDDFPPTEGTESHMKTQSQSEAEVTLTELSVNKIDATRSTEPPVQARSIDPGPMMADKVVSEVKATPTLQEVHQMTESSMIPATSVVEVEATATSEVMEESTKQQYTGQNKKQLRLSKQRDPEKPVIEPTATVQIKAQQTVSAETIETFNHYESTQSVKQPESASVEKSEKEPEGTMFETRTHSLDREQRKVKAEEIKGQQIQMPSSTKYAQGNSTYSHEGKIKQWIIVNW